MSNRELPMMPWYPDQFAASTRCWSFNERSAYRALLDVQWAIGPLPEDLARLGGAIGMAPPEFAEVWPVVGSKFVRADGGGLINQRLESHRLYARDRKAKQSDAGRIGGKASGEARSKRSLNNRSTVASSSRSTVASSSRSTVASTVAERSLPPVVNPPSPSPSPSEESKSARASGSETVPRETTTDDPTDRAAFLRLKAAYPPGVYPQSDWLTAERDACQRIEEGHTWAELTAGAERYAAQCVARNCGTQYVASPVKFFTRREQKFLEPFPLPVVSQARSSEDTGWRPTS